MEHDADPLACVEGSKVVEWWADVYEVVPPDVFAAPVEAVPAGSDECRRVVEVSNAAESSVEFRNASWGRSLCDVALHNGDS